jgi:hypothetical protein
VLAFDQTIRNAGWALIVHEAIGTRVVKAGTCRTRPGELGGWESTLSDAVEVARQIEGVVAMADDWVATSTRYSSQGLFEVAHEAPPLGGNSAQMKRSESTVLAALGVRMACSRLGVRLTMQQNQSVKRLLFDVGTGEGQVKLGDITKARLGHAVAALEWLEGREQLTNEHQRDAAGIALLRLSRPI